MPDPQRMLALYARVAQLTRTTPGRRGRLVELADVDEVFIAGDLHGNLENFRVLYKLADLDRFPRRHFVLQEVIHGPFDYPAESGGGDRSHQLLDLVAGLKVKYPTRFHFFPGNHEMAQFTDRTVFKNDCDLNSLFEQGVHTAYHQHGLNVLKAYRDWFFTLPLALRTPNRIFLSHSLPSAVRLDSFALDRLTDEEVPDTEWHPGGSLYSLCWGRDTSQANAEAFLRKVDADLLITGHIPLDQGYSTPNTRQLILDTLGTPAAYCLFPTNRPLTLQELVDCVHIL